MTSRVNAPPRPGDHRVQALDAAGLPLPSLVRSRLATLHASHIVKRLGALAPHDLTAVDTGLRSVLGL